MNYKAVLFDADGTILDTREYIYQAFERTLAHHGHEVPSREALTSQMGAHVLDIYKGIAPEGDHEALVAHHRMLHDGELLPLVAPYQGARDVLDALKDAGFKVGVCTNRGSAARNLLKKAGLYDALDSVATVDDVVNPKPHPEMAHKVLDALGATPDETLLVGDTGADIQTGKNANLAQVVGITHGFGSEAFLREVGADTIIHSLAELLPILDLRAREGVF
jgi:pyrophosphatase PpaX